MKLKNANLVLYFLLIPLFAVYMLRHNLSWRDLLGITSFWALLLILAAVVYSFALHVLLHEVGHLLFGKLTGYQLLFFQVLNFRYTSKDKAFKKKKPEGQGMAGQCLMVPPKEGEYAEKPFFWYLAGGLILNGAAVLLFFAGSYYLQGKWSFYSFLFSLPPLFLFLANAIPQGYTDGRLIKEVSNSDLAKRLFFKQLEVAALLEEGAGFDEIPSFYLEEAEEGSSGESFLGEYMELCAYRRQLAKHDFTAADERLQVYASHFDYKKSAYAPVLLCEKLYCDALFGRREEAREQLQTISKYPSVRSYYQNSRRIQAAYAFFVETNVETAKEMLQESPEEWLAGALEAERRLELGLLDWQQTYFTDPL